MAGLTPPLCNSIWAIKSRSYRSQIMPARCAAEFSGSISTDPEICTEDGCSRLCTTGVGLAPSGGLRFRTTEQHTKPHRMMVCGLSKPLEKQAQGQVELLPHKKNHTRVSVPSVAGHPVDGTPDAPGELQILRHCGGWGVGTGMEQMFSLVRDVISSEGCV